MGEGWERRPEANHCRPEIKGIKRQGRDPATTYDFFKLFQTISNYYFIDGKSSLRIAPQNFINIYIYIYIYIFCPSSGLVFTI